mgnify:CR=1 FL=1
MATKDTGEISIVSSYYPDTSLRKYSRYRRSKVNQYSDGSRRFEIRDPIVFQETPSDNLYYVETGMANDLTLIAWKFYKNTLLWWVIAEANDIRDPFDVPVGTILRIPSIKSLFGRKAFLA